MKASTPTTEKQASNNAVTRQTFTGVVSSNKMKDTVTVVISRFVKHAKYQKFINKRTKIMAHDAGNTKKIGDTVTVEACRPMSKNKSFKVIA